MQKLLQLFKTHPFLEGKILDSVFILFMPILSIFLGSVLFQQVFTTQGEAPANKLNLVFLVITQMHLVMVFFRVYNNPEIKKSYRNLIGIPLLVFGLLLAVDSLFFITIFLTMMLDPYHTGTQNYRLGREYDGKLEESNKGKLLDHALSLFIHLFPVLYLVPTSKLQELLNLGEATTAASTLIETNLLLALGQVQPLLPILFGTFLVIYFLGYKQLVSQGYKLSIHKIILFSVSLMVNIIVWKSFEPIVAVITINLYHAMQYIFFVWHLEKDNLQNRFKASKTLSFMIFILTTAIYGLVMANNFNIWLSKIALAVVLLHYIFDALVWKKK